MATELIPKFYKKELADGMAAEDLYLMLLTSAHAPNASTQQFISDVSANEIVDSAGNYVAGGVQLAGKEGKYHTANAFVDASDVAIGRAM